MKTFGRYLVESTQTLYHGTSSVVADGIKDNGLIPHASKKTTPEHDNDGDRANCVYLSLWQHIANDYARRAVHKLGGTPIVVTVRIPSEFTHNVCPDEQDPLGVRFRGTIPVEWISLGTV